MLANTLPPPVAVTGIGIYVHRTKIRMARTETTRNHSSVLLLDFDAETPSFQTICMGIQRPFSAPAVTAVDVLIALWWRGVAGVFSAHDEPPA